MDYYALLGVIPVSNSGDIRTAYRKQAMKWHPDRWSKDPVQAEQAKTRFQAIQEAYQVLSDHNKRILYDASLRESDLDDPEEVEDKSSSLHELQGMLRDIVCGWDDDVRMGSRSPTSAAGWRIQKRRRDQTLDVGRQVVGRTGRCCNRVQRVRC